MKHKSFSALRQSAVEAFIKTAILIDNEPMTLGSPTEGEGVAMVAKSSAYGVGESVGFLQIREDREPIPAPVANDRTSHRLWVQPVTNGFASKRITCGFYFPANEEVQIVETALNAARHVDATVVDWQLRPKDTGPARDLITRLLKDDLSVGGRLRLIIVYTGERGIDVECAKLLAHLNAEGLTDLKLHDEGRALVGSNVLVTFANKPRAVKPDEEISGPGARPIAWERLPEFVLEQYSLLAKGLLQAFALKAIGAVRDDTHHLLSVFNSSLDAAYLAQRAGIGTPSDAEDLMTSLLTSEFACSILDRGVATEILGASGAVHAISARHPSTVITIKKYNDPQKLYGNVVEAPKGGGTTLSTTAKNLERLVKIGLDGAVIPWSTENVIRLKQQFFENDEIGTKAMSTFARMASFVREADGKRRLVQSSIYLTGGVVIRSVTGKAKSKQETYLLCVQPGCDAVRLTTDTAFPFCLLVPDEKHFDLVVQVDGTDKQFRMSRLPRDLVMKAFSPHKTREVVVARKFRNRMGFKSVDNVFWDFVAELRQPESQHFATLLIGKFSRVALNGSEWLRLKGPR